MIGKLLKNQELRNELPKVTDWFITKTNLYNLLSSKNVTAGFLHRPTMRFLYYVGPFPPKGR